MSVQYNNSLKKKLCEDICLHGKSTSITAKEYGIPLKTLEKWITSFHKDSNCFDDNDDNDFKIISSLKNSIYDNLSYEELKETLMKKDIEIARLKKGYMVKEGGMGKKEFITFYKKNTK